MQQLRAMFFDIGGTLGEVDVPSLTLKLFPTTRGVLSAAQTLGLKLGVISNVPPGVDLQRISAMLKQAGVLEFFQAQAIITSTDAGSAKPSKGIYAFAAKSLDLPPAACVYVGENPQEVAGALKAGMQAIQKS